MAGRRKDGTVFPLHLAVSELELDDRRMFAGIAKDITWLKRAEAEMARYVESLARSNASLEQFAYAASHDLQEPLRKVQTFADRIKSRFGEQLGEEGNDYLERMQSAARRMQGLIRDLLSYSRVGTQAKPFVAVHLGIVVKEVLSDLEVRIEQVGGSIEVGELPSIQADPMQMRQLFQNLIGNALKFHYPGVKPVVRITAQLKDGGGSLTEGRHPRDEMCHIEVVDNGIGFDEKYLGRLFTVFQRLHGQSEFPGSGIGLAICREIVERHGGKITARSRPGEGATFLVILPLHQQAETAAARPGRSVPA